MEGAAPFGEGVFHLWRDGRVQRIYGGTNEIMKDIIGKDLLA